MEFGLGEHYLTLYMEW